MNNTEIKCPVCGSTKNKGFCPTSSDGSWSMYKCRGCLTHFQHPNMQAKCSYNEDYFSGIGNDKFANYISTDWFEHNVLRDRIKKIITIRKSYLYSPHQLNILDIGPGNGSFCITAQGFGNVCAMDITNSNEKTIRSNGYSGRFVKNNLEIVSPNEISDFKNYFDIINISEVIEHLSFPDIFFKNIANITREGGVIFIQTGRSDSMVSAVCGKRWRYYRIVHSIIYSKKSIKLILVRAGFVVISVKRDFESFTEMSKLIFANLSENPKRCIMHLLAFIMGKCLPNMGRIQIIARKVKA